jgi:hypothetical protein
MLQSKRLPKAFKVALDSKHPGAASTPAASSEGAIAAAATAAAAARSESARAAAASESALSASVGALAILLSRRAVVDRRLRLLQSVYIRESV